MRALCTFRAVHQAIKLARTAASVARARRNAQAQIPQSYGAPVTYRLSNRTILGGQPKIFVHHIHQEGVCVVSFVDNVQQAVVRE